MFELIYYEFIKKINEVNIKNNKDLILINEKKLRAEIQRFFMLMLKSKDYVRKSIKVLTVTQKRFEEEISKLSKKITVLRNKLKKTKNKRKNTIPRRKTMYGGGYSQRVVSRFEETKARSQSKKPEKTRKVSKRAKTPNLGKSFKTKTNTRDKSKTKTATSTNKKAKTQKNIKIDTSAEKQSILNKTMKNKIPQTASPISKVEPILKGKVSKNILSNKILPTKVSEPKIEVENKTTPYGKTVNSSKKSLFNNSVFKTSIYDMTNISLNNVLLSQDLTLQKQDPINEITTAIFNLRQALVIDKLDKQERRKIKVGINKRKVHNKLIKKFEKRLNGTGKKRKGLSNKPKDYGSDSDISAMNPLEL